MHVADFRFIARFRHDRASNATVVENQGPNIVLFDHVNIRVGLDEGLSEFTSSVPSMNKPSDMHLAGRCSAVRVS